MMENKRTVKSTDPSVLIRLLDRSSRSSEPNGNNEFHGMLSSALFGNPSQIKAIYLS